MPVTLSASSPQLAIDLAWWRPDPNLVREAGYVAAVRYLSSDSTKALSVDEAARWHAAEVALGLVFEDGEQNALGGASQGQRDAQIALQQCDALSYPVSSPVWFAVDFNAQPDQMPTVIDYLKAAHDTFGDRNFKAGYGSWNLVQAAWAAGISGDWQTEAWSGTAVNPQASLYQRVRPTLNITGGSGQYDENVILSPIPWWGTAPPPPAPTPPPPPAPTPPKNPFLPLPVNGLFTPPVCAAMQWVLKVATDGLFGPHTKVALQERLHVTPDGVVGPVTVEALQRHIGTTPDGIWGVRTSSALEEHLNNNTF